jgi:hypothetical protein
MVSVTIGSIRGRTPLSGPGRRDGAETTLCRPLKLQSKLAHRLDQDFDPDQKFQSAFEWHLNIQKMRSSITETIAIRAAAGSTTQSGG